MPLLRVRLLCYLELMPDYQNMSWLEALRYAKDVSGLTAEEIATRMGVKPSIVRRYLQNAEGYAPGLDKLPALCSALGNTVLLQWLTAQLEPADVEVLPARDRAEVLTAVASASAALGDVQRRLVETAQAGIDPACARELRSMLLEVILECQRSQSMLLAQAQARDRTEVEVLFSIKPERRSAPWWKFWER